MSFRAQAASGDAGARLRADEESQGHSERSAEGAQSRNRRVAGRRAPLPGERDSSTARPTAAPLGMTRAVVVVMEEHFHEARSPPHVDLARGNGRGRAAAPVQFPRRTQPGTREKPPAPDVPGRGGLGRGARPLSTQSGVDPPGELPPRVAPAFGSPGGFLAFEHALAIPAAFEMHRTIGRDQIASRIDELSTAFKDGASKIRGATTHTPHDPRLSAGISCFDVAGLSAEAVTQRLTARKFRTTSSPYKTSYARVATGVMNTPAEIERVLEAIREIAT